MSFHLFDRALHEISVQLHLSGHAFLELSLVDDFHEEQMVGYWKLLKSALGLSSFG